MWARSNRNRYVNKKWANVWELEVLCLKASINETWLRVQRPSCSAPFTTSFFFCQPGRGDSSGNGFLKQLEGVKGSHDSSLGPISSHGALSIPEGLRTVWYWITLIRPLPFSQRHLLYSLTFVVLFFFLQALDEIMITGCKGNPILLHLLYLPS